jgi:hypothetical protein
VPGQSKTRVLVVADATALTPDLVNALRARAVRGPTQFRIVVPNPASAELHLLHPERAEAAARAVLSGRATATAKSGDGQFEMVRMFRLAKASAIKIPRTGDQSAQSHPRPRRHRLARVDDRPEQPGTVSPLRATETRLI